MVGVTLLFVIVLVDQLFRYLFANL